MVVHTRLVKYERIGKCLESCVRKAFRVKYWSITSINTLDWHLSWLIFVDIQSSVDQYIVTRHLQLSTNSWLNVNWVAVKPLTKCQLSISCYVFFSTLKRCEIFLAAVCINIFLVQVCLKDISKITNPAWTSNDPPLTFCSLFNCRLAWCATSKQFSLVTFDIILDTFWLN